MRNYLKTMILSAAVVGVTASVSQAVSLLAPGDFILGIDADITSASSHPVAEDPPKLIDGIVGTPGTPEGGNGSGATKYLNFGERGSGFIVTPGIGPSTIQSFQITTANDSASRDPASYKLFGTNDLITSTNNSNGLAETWTLISEGGLSLPLQRNALAAAVDVANSSIYTSYKMYFPTVKDQVAANSMQINEMQFFSQPGATGLAILTPTTAGTAIIAIDNPEPESEYPNGERPLEAIDGITTSGSKYLNFGRERAGLIVRPGVGPTIVNGLRIWAANDAVPRDPTQYEIYGTNDAIISPDQSTGTAENWVLISAGALAIPDTRNTSTTSVEAPPVTFANDVAYSAYKILFPENKGPDLPTAGGANSIQFSEIQLEGIVVPEPSSLVLAGIGAVMGLTARRRRQI